MLNKKKHKLTSILAFLITISFICLIIVIAIYSIAHKDYLLIANPEAWGLFGDYFAGILSPILSFVTIVMLVFTLTLQREDLKLTREELKETTNVQKNQAVALNRQIQVRRAASRVDALTVLIHIYNDLYISNYELLIMKKAGRGNAGYYEKRQFYEEQLLSELKELGLIVSPENII